MGSFHFLEDMITFELSSMDIIRIVLVEECFIFNDFINAICIRFLLTLVLVFFC